MLTSAGLIDAKVVQVDAANDLALLKADGRFAPLLIAASRTVNLGGTVATVGFPDIGLQGFAPRKVTSDVWRVDKISRHLSPVTRHIPCVGGAGGKRVVAGECELCGQEQFSVELPGIGAGSLGQTQSASHG